MPWTTRRETGPDDPGLGEPRRRAVRRRRRLGLFARRARLGASPFLLILAVTAIAGWNAAAMAGRTVPQPAHRRGAAARRRPRRCPTGWWSSTGDDRIVFYNSRYPEHDDRGAARGPGASASASRTGCARGSSAGPVYHPDMGEDFLAHRLAMRQGRHSEHAMRIADGRWMRVRDNMMEDGSRVLLITDITEERRRAAELRLLALAVEQAGDPVEITGADHGFTYVNHAFETTTGYTAAEALGLQPQEILSSGLQPPEFFAEMRRELEAGRTWQGTIINRHRDGHLIEQETTIAPLRDESGAHDALRGGQARRDRGAGPGPGAGGERGALPRGGGRADRVHRAGRAGRLLDLHERGGGALHRHDAGGDARHAACATST